MGCAFLVRPEALERNRETINKTFLARKSQIGMARLLGPLFVARFLTHRLTVADIERRCLSLLGCSGRGIRGCAPELAMDIDGPEDYAMPSNTVRACDERRRPRQTVRLYFD